MEPKLRIVQPSVSKFSFAENCSLGSLSSLKNQENMKSKRGGFPDEMDMDRTVIFYFAKAHNLCHPPNPSLCIV
jgi:hypothetical protein